MHRRGVAWLLAGAALLACPSAASGSIPAALETFSGAWPQGCPEVTIEQGTDPDPTVSGFATPGTCVIYVTPTFLAKQPSADLICAVVVHEYGHLLGLGHSGDESDVMFPSPLPPAACLPDEDDGTATATASTASAVNADAATVTLGYQQPTTTGNRRTTSRSRSCARRSKASTAKARSARTAKARTRKARSSRRSCRR